MRSNISSTISILKNSNYVIEEAIDCSGRCACCIDEEFGCGTSPGIHGDTSCLKGSVDTIYGHRCKNPCRSNCLKCTQDIGECFACKPGFYGNLTNCVDSCSIRCIDGTCENDGRCTCIQNFEGNKCDTCVQGRYGDNCEHTCSIGCIGNTCNRNGSCSCLHNFNGQNCDVCAANYEGSACESCDDGFYGKYCSKSCILVDSNCLKCKRDDEYCMKCKNGYFSSNGNCVECGINCLERKCDPTNGRCTLGCKAGFWSDICDANCNLNCSSCGQFSSVCLQCTTDVAYGPFCNMSCNSSFVQSRCHSVTGTCTHGCIFNRHGSYCEKECSDNCEQNDGQSPCNSRGFA
ncbi:multiple epidermal growth factor-like domains protein 11 [Mya arenaria]|uniref:multiple epidermal growth factor-like domains protein 11 n=1 Tax=Mya arenaria TaxID=6604 RepID=UPI0022E1EC86|nr:multiple epidermal growth factor-like domains protein 11 [Mya arenaria]